MENMGQWIFKAIYIPITAMIFIACMIVLVEIVKGAGWNAPFRWLLIINVIAATADIFMRKL